MALAHFTKVFAIKEAKVAKMLTDPVAAPPATYGSSFPLVGAKKLAVTGVVNTKYLRGDNMLLDSDTVFDSLSAVIDYAKLSLDALAVMFSTAVVDSGVTPNQLATWAQKNTDTLQYFRMEARSASADIVTGDVLFSLWKCKISSFPSTGLNEEDYQLANVAVTLVPRLADNNWLSVVYRETAAALT